MSILPTEASTLLIGATAVIIGIWYFRSKRNLPPGPTPLPVVGNLLAIGKAKSMTEALKEYRKQYGNIFTIHLGSHPVIVLCGQKMIREALVSNADLFSGRPENLTIPKATFGNKGIILDPHNWKANRKSALVTLRDFGLGKHSLEDKVCQEAMALCQHLESMEGQTVDIKPHLSKAFSNVICTIVFGQRFEYDDPKFTHLMELMDLTFSSAGNEAAIIDHIPMLMFLPKFKAQYNAVMGANAKTEKYIQDIIDEHKQSFDPDNLRDFIDLYLKSDPGNESTARAVIKELFFAGTETSGTTLSWALLLMAKHPDIQKKCQEEIKKVIGSSRGPRLTDKGSLPYTEATLQEIQRFVSIAPVALPHRVAEDTAFAGYQLPKDAMVIAYLDSCHHDPEVWPDHDEFKPERWLDASGKMDGKNSSFMPFSVGRRSCLGEQLAKTELFIMFISVLQQFEFSAAPGKSVSLEGHLGVTYGPVDTQLLYKKRDA